MVRKCIVPNCKSIDNKILCHRFPAKDELACEWTIELKLDMTKYTKNDLKKYVVCTMHFDKKDYKNELSNGLNSTALPKLEGHEPRIKNFIDNVQSVSTYEIAILKQKCEPNDDILQNRYRYELQDENSTYSQDPFGIVGFTEIDRNDEKFEENSTMETSIIECTESEISRIEDYDDQDCSSENYLISNDEPLATQSLQIQQYESDVEIIDYDAVDNEVTQNEVELDIISNDLQKYESCGNGNLSETVSLISSIAEIDDDGVVQEAEKAFADAACQSDPVEIYCKDELNDYDDEDYKNKSRKDLIELIKEQKKKILEVDKKLKEFQATHIKLVQSMDTFKILLTSDIANSS